jgi:DNA-3-methyladenine glycosylase II
LRRLSTNVVDSFDDKGIYARAFRNGGDESVLEVRDEPAGLTVTVSGALPDAQAIVERMLGTTRDLTGFYAAAKAIPWLGALALRLRGVKPPRYPTLWEAIVNAVVFQQVSIHAASAILRRTIASLEEPVHHGEALLYPFPAPSRFLAAEPDALRATGLSVNKVVALRVLARAVEEGELRDELLEALPTVELVERLIVHRGIGPWTAAVVALRGFGRLDVFPMRDSGVARTLRELSGAEHIDAEAILEALGAERGMLYYHLLLGRLAARGDIEA